ncbi:MAG: 50S ribosomal protein L24 [Solobacterium sp.]|jgi:large subunit ribosomal protein L24|nr:50S ribosomal protein L24 [Solobacterium sp.]
MKIKTGDTVKVITGHYKGNIGEVIKAYPKKNQVVVEGVNMIKKTVKPSDQNPEGGIIEREAPIDASNVMLYDKKAKTASRVGYKFNDKGEKVRYYKKSGEVVKEANK